MHRALIQQPRTNAHEITARGLLPSSEYSAVYVFAQLCMCLLSKHPGTGLSSGCRQRGNFIPEAHEGPVSQTDFRHPLCEKTGKTAIEEEEEEEKGGGGGGGGGGEEEETLPAVEAPPVTHPVSVLRSNIQGCLLSSSSPLAASPLAPARPPLPCAKSLLPRARAT